MEAKHSPLPWLIEDRTKREDFTITDAEDCTVCVIPRSRYVDERSDPTTKANAELIVRAVNSHAALLSALNDLVAEHDDQVFICGIDDTARVERRLDAARAALAKATA